MVTRIGKFRRKTRSKLSKDGRSKGKIKLSTYFQSFKEGDKVALKPEPAIHKGMSHPRFQGRIGSIMGKEGRCYRVALKDQNKLKTIVVHPVHLRRV